MSEISCVHYRLVLRNELVKITDVLHTACLTNVKDTHKVHFKNDGLAANLKILTSSNIFVIACFSEMVILPTACPRYKGSVKFIFQLQPK